MHSHSDTILWGLVLMQAELAAEGRELKVVVCRQAGWDRHAGPQVRDSTLQNAVW